MTGYGCGEGAHDGCKVTVEISSVNRKQAEVSVNLPRDLDVLEARIRDEIHRRLSRGRVSVRVTVHQGEARRAGRVRINHALAGAYAREFAVLAEELRLEGRPSLDVILRAPGVLDVDDEVEDAEAFWPALSAALADALEQLVRMREQEGTFLARDLEARLKILREHVHAVREQAPRVAETYRRQLHERIAAAGVLLGAEDQDRLLKEVAMFADRSDITEELTRLMCHFTHFEECLTSAEPTGRALDFLAQEMNREVNTVGSKANDALIARHVVQLKAELERIREQAQNIE